MRVRSAIVRVVGAAVLLAALGPSTANATCLRCILFGEEAICIDDFWGGDACAYHNNGDWCIQYGDQCYVTQTTPIMRMFLADGTVPAPIGDLRYGPTRGCGGVLLMRTYTEEEGSKRRHATRRLII